MVELEAEEINEFLADGGTDVLSFGSEGGEPPHSVPVSYGHDAATRTFYFRLAVGPESAKRDRLDPGSLTGRREASTAD